MPDLPSSRVATLELIVFSGLPASGKTSFYRRHFAATHAHVSKDAWPNARNKERRQRCLIEHHLAAGRSVVIDNTNPTPDERQPLIALGHAFGARVTSYAFLVTVDEALHRNVTRTGRARITDIGIFSIAARLRAPPRPSPSTPASPSPSPPTTSSSRPSPPARADP